MKSWKQIIASVAPALATALGGPLAGMAVRQLSAKLGLPEDTTEEQLGVAVEKMTAADLLKLKEADLEFKKAMRDADIKLEAIDAQDRASARARQVSMKDHTPTVLAFIVLVGFCIAAAWVCTQRIPAETQPVVMVMLGTLGTLATTVVTYYFGSSRSSRTKDEIIEKVTGTGTGK